MVSFTAIADGRRRVSAGWPLPRAVLVLLGVAGAVVAAAGLRSAAGIVGPAFLALTIVITIHPLLAWLQRHHLPGWLAVTLTMLVTYAALCRWPPRWRSLGGAASPEGAQAPR